MNPSSTATTAGQTPRASLQREDLAEQHFGRSPRGTTSMQLVRLSNPITSDQEIATPKMSPPPLVERPPAGCNPAAHLPHRQLPQPQLPPTLPKVGTFQWAFDHSISRNHTNPADATATGGQVPRGRDCRKDRALLGVSEQLGAINIKLKAQLARGTKAPEQRQR